MSNKMIRRFLTAGIVCGLIQFSVLATPVSSQEDNNVTGPIDQRVVSPVFTDSFETDSSKDYSIEGETAWSAGKVELPANASLGRELNAGAWLKTQIQFEPPPISDVLPGSEFQIRLVFSGATDCVVRLIARKVDDQQVYQVSVLDTVDQSGSLHEIRRGEISGPGPLNLEYRFGLVTVGLGSDEVVRGYIENREAAIRTVLLETGENQWTVTDWQTATNRDPRANPTEERKRQLGEANQLMQQLVRAFNRSDFAGAETLMHEYLAMLERALGRYNMDYARGMTEMGLLYYQFLARHEEAKLALQRGVEIRKALLGSDHPSYAYALMRFGGFYANTSQAAEAEKLLREALTILERSSGKESYDYGECLKELGEAYRLSSEYAKSVQCLKESIEIQERLPRTVPMTLATTLMNLAASYLEMEDLIGAEKNFLRAAEVIEKGDNQRHPIYVALMMELGVLYTRKEEFAKAERCLLKAHEVNPHESVIISRLGTLYRQMKRYDDAEQRFLQAMRIDATTNANGYAVTLNNLAGVYMDTGQFDKAEPLFRETLAIFEEAQLGNARNYAATTQSLGLLLDSRGEYDAASKLIFKAAYLIRRRLDQTMLYQSERQAKLLQIQENYVLNRLISNAFRRPDASTAEVIEVVWQWKGSVTMRQRAFRSLANDPALAPRFRELQQVSRNLSALGSRAPVPPPRSAPDQQRAAFEQQLGAWSQKFNALSDEREQIEREIAAASSAFDSVQRPLSVSRVQQMMPPDTVLVDFLEFWYSQADEEVPGQLNWERRYACFIVPREGPPAMLDLGDSQSIEDAVQAFRELLQSGTAEQSIFDSDSARQLAQRVWQPVKQRLPRGITQIIISPDTRLGNLPFGVLPAGSGNRYLIEDYIFVSIPIVNLLRIPESTRAHSIPEVLVVADVDYDARPASDASVQATANWQPLPGFRKELEAIKNIYRVAFRGEQDFHALTGEQATEAKFLEAASGARVLHLITHGFYVLADKDALAASPSAARIAELTSQVGVDPATFSLISHLYSGLVMAGANYQSPERDQLTGFLHAGEIEAASLQGVDLVVMSACESGLGAVAGGEGLTGLQRAFHVAGARSVIASLWKVNDTATTLLMARFYRNLWEKGMSKAAALREAQLWLLNNPQSLTDATRGEPIELPLATVVEPDRNADPNSQPTARTHPRYWAAWVLSGDGR